MIRIMNINVRMISHVNQDGKQLLRTNRIFQYYDVVVLLVKSKPSHKVIIISS